MDIVQNFYDNLASQYDKLFQDWHSTTVEQAAILDKIFIDNRSEKGASILDCACDIGTQSIVIAMDNALPHMLTSEDLSKASESIASCVSNGGIFVAGIRAGA